MKPKICMAFVFVIAAVITGIVCSIMGITQGALTIRSVACIISMFFLSMVPAIILVAMLTTGRLFIKERKKFE